ncbi:MAG TPA: class I SAM-dependent methyltransferase [Candidatus Tumulicola sp.]
MHAGRSREEAYVGRLAQEQRRFDTVSEFDDLPPIYHYWSNTFVRAMLERVGCSDPRGFLARYLQESARRCAAERPVFLSIGSGDGNNELEIARRLKSAGMGEFTIECLELNTKLIKRATYEARLAGLESHVIFARQDFNAWRPSRVYHGVVANQSLHHVTNLEGLFDAIGSALAPGAFFVANDVIGRNGHQRWPEARHLVERFWQKLPASYHYHHQFQRQEELFEDWDCSSEGFEGIRAQDVLPLLLERFHFHIFIGFGNVIDPFVDRGFGPNFDVGSRWDRAFIDRVHACDERGLLDGCLTPTHMMAVMAKEPSDSPDYARGLTPEAAVRRPDRISDSAEIERTDRALSMYFEIPQLPADDAVGESGGFRLPLVGCVAASGSARGGDGDGWAARTLEFTVVPERDVARFSVHATLPEGVPAEAELWVVVDGASVCRAPASRSVVLDCSLRLVRGVPVTIAICASATVNLKQLGLGDDERDLGFHLDDVVFEP